ncbi:hypothetical protein [Bacillus sp. JCM 19041]|uniref:hypothetical protein n=1 Tax=Bacillus sp. JCM 19041 TaxID=1460637 RepID=UPI0006CFCBC8
MDATPKSISTKIDFWWRIEVILWIPFFLVIILCFVLWVNYGTMQEVVRIYVVAVVAMRVFFLLALIPKTIKCHYLGLRRKYVYGAFALFVAVDTIRGVRTLLSFY